MQIAIFTVKLSNKFNFKDNGILIGSLDACFGLARRKGRGDTSISLRHGTLLFSDQDDVDNFVDNYEHVKTKQVMKACNIWCASGKSEEFLTFITLF